MSSPSFPTPVGPTECSPQLTEEEKVLNDESTVSIEEITKIFFQCCATLREGRDEVFEFVQHVAAQYANQIDIGKGFITACHYESYAPFYALKDRMPQEILMKGATAALSQDLGGIVRVLKDTLSSDNVQQLFLQACKDSKIHSVTVLVNDTRILSVKESGISQVNPKHLGVLKILKR